MKTRLTLLAVTLGTLLTGCVAPLPPPPPPNADQASARAVPPPPPREPLPLLLPPLILPIAPVPHP